MRIAGCLRRIFDCVENAEFSCLISQAGTFQGIYRHSGQICTFHPGKMLERKNLSRLYDKITYCNNKDLYYSISQKVPGCIFVLDQCFREVDCLRPRLEECINPINDIWFDPVDGLLWIANAAGCHRLNCNGDYLGVFMSPTRGTEYVALCTHGEYLFIASYKGNCSYLTSYNKTGVYLEHVCLGCEYAVRNIQVISYNDKLVLRVYAIRDFRLPTIVEVELSDRKKSPDMTSAIETFTVDCVIENSDICATCYIDANPQNNNL